ncbi:MAG: dTDP-4-dehydrorhamnose reductase [Gammaproteobacteria bacterium]
MANRKAIVVTGGTGQLGLTLQALWPHSALAASYDLLAFSSSELDITSADSISNALPNTDVAAIVNAAAYTAVDAAEADSEQAHLINAAGATSLATWSAEHNVRLLHVSTDFVFNGKADTPYGPDSPVEPLGVYGASKLAGERAIARIWPQRSLVLRTSWLYSPYKNNFVKTMLRLMAERDALNVVSDQIGSPTSTQSLAQVIFAALASDVEQGIYHWSDGAQISWYDFAVAIQAEGLAQGLLTKPIAINPIPTSEYPTPATRPAYSVMDASATQRDFACPVQSWRDELRNVIAQLAVNQAA